MVIEVGDLIRHRLTAYRTWAHPLARTVVDLADEVELLRMQLNTLIADNDRLRTQIRDLSLSDNAGCNGSDDGD